MSALRVAAVIPARMGSTRFPGKPLLPVRGLPMVEHVRRRALLSGAFSDVVVATCDAAIAAAVADYGGRVIMTSPQHPGAADRVCEAMEQLDCTHVANVQGDEILVLPEDLARLVAAMRAQPEGPAWNAVAPITEAAALGDRSIVKCAVSRGGRFLFCARDFTAATAGLAAPYDGLRIVLGLTGYTREFLSGYARLARTPLECAGGMDQLRLLEHDVPLRAVEFAHGYAGINEPREVAGVERTLTEDARQRAALQRVLADEWTTGFRRAAAVL